MDRMNLDQAVATLTEALEATEEVRQFRAARERAKADPGARAAMERYMQQMQGLSNSAAPPEQWQVLQRVQQSLALHPALQQYMQAEARLGRLLHEVLQTAAAACGLEADP